MPEVADNDLVNRLKNDDNTAFERLYDDCFYSIANYVKQNSGSEQDAEDLFQETVLVLLHKIRQPDFTLTSSLKTYLFSVSKNLWLKKLRSDRLVSVGDEHISPFLQDEADEPESPIEQNLSVWMSSITKHCQKIISALFFHQVAMDKLMLAMGWKNKHTAAQQKHKCLQQIKSKAMQ